MCSGIGFDVGIGYGGGEEDVVMMYVFGNWIDYGLVIMVVCY